MGGCEGECEAMVKTTREFLVLLAMQNIEDSPRWDVRCLGAGESEEHQRSHHTVMFSPISIYISETRREKQETL